MDERERRIGENEALFREVNERVEGLNRSLATLSKRMKVVCECGRQDCLEQIDLGLDEYERVRANPAHFVVKPGHELPEAEDVVDSTEHYYVVQKHAGGPEQLARATDPRH